MRGVVAALAVIGCGRVAFDFTRSDGSLPDDADDATVFDVAVPDAGLPAGLVAHYTFDGSGGSVIDVVGARNGTCPALQCPPPTMGHIGNGRLFDGTDDCLTVTDDGAFQLPKITLSVWARQDAAGTMSHVAKRVLGGSVNSWQIETDPLGGDPNTISFTTYDGSGLNVYAITADNTITIGQWHHIAVSFDGDTKRVYIDGAEKTFVTGHPALAYDNMVVKIGCDDNAPEARFFNGALDELQIYGRALSPAEIAFLATR